MGTEPAVTTEQYRDREGAAGHASRSPRPDGGKGACERESLHPAIPYLVITGLATIVGLALGFYLWLNREEIVRILTVSPT